MKLNQADLNRIVAFVKAVKEIPGNEQFIAELRRVLEVEPATPAVPAVTVTPAQSLGSTRTTKIDAIEEYLGLDFQLDSATPVVDYSFVADEQVRVQLQADCREMLRYRYGTRGHKVDFLEFCRYVQLQSEMLLSYYYNLRFEGDKDAIFSHLTGILPNEKSKYVTYKMMLDGFCKEHNIVGDRLDKVREARNSQSHRQADSPDYSQMLSEATRFVEAHKANYKVYLFNDKNDIYQPRKLFVATALDAIFTQQMGKTHWAYNNILARLHFIELMPFADIIADLRALAQQIARLV